LVPVAALADSTHEIEVPPVAHPDILDSVMTTATSATESFRHSGKVGGLVGLYCRAVTRL